MATKIENCLIENMRLSGPIMIHEINFTILSIIRINWFGFIVYYCLFIYYQKKILSNVFLGKQFLPVQLLHKLMSKTLIVDKADLICKLCRDQYSVTSQFAQIQKFSLNVCQACFKKNHRIVNSQTYEIYEMSFINTGLMLMETTKKSAKQQRPSIIELAQKNKKDKTIFYELGNISKLQQNLKCEIDTIQKSAYELAKCQINSILRKWEEFMLASKFTKYKINFLIEKLKDHLFACLNDKEVVDNNSIEKQNKKEQIETPADKIKQLKKRSSITQKSQLLMNQYCQGKRERIKQQLDKLSKLKNNLETYFLTKQNSQLKQTKKTEKQTTPQRKSKLIELSQKYFQTNLKTDQSQRNRRNRTVNWFTTQKKTKQQKIKRVNICLKLKTNHSSKMLRLLAMLSQLPNFKQMIVDQSDKPNEITIKNNFAQQMTLPPLSGRRVNKKKTIKTEENTDKMTEDNKNSISKCKENTVANRNTLELLYEDISSIQFQKYLQSFKNFKRTIRTVRMIKVGLTDEKLKILLEWLGNAHNLEAIILNNNKLTQSSLKIISQFVTKSKNELKPPLLTFYLSNNNIKLSSEKSKEISKSKAQIYL